MKDGVIEKRPQEWSIVDATVTKLEPEEAEALGFHYGGQLEKGLYFKQGNKMVGYCEWNVKDNSPKEGKVLWIDWVQISPRARMTWLNSRVAEEFVQKLKEYGLSQGVSYVGWKSFANSVERLSGKIGAKSVDSDGKVFKDYLFPIDQVDVGLLKSRI